jgi:dTDP-4-dehydrorhamnose reductase
MPIKTLILGANGMAGHVISTGLQRDPNFEVISVARTKSIFVPSILLDVSDLVLFKDFLSKIQVDIIVNCLGVLNRSAEENPAEAILINSYLPHFIEFEKKTTNTKIIHISTDCVFSGEQGHYDEKSFKNGKGFYAQSKAIGEIENTKDLTFRTSIIGPELKTNGIGLFNWFAKQEDTLNGFTHAFWTGITTIELLSAVKQAIYQDLTGLYHLVNNTKISKFDLLNILNDVFQRNLKLQPCDDYRIDKSLVNNRNDFGFIVKSYEEMIWEMRLWIQSNRDLYSHYHKIL